jgi:hypothetical protein
MSEEFHSFVGHVRDGYSLMSIAHLLERHGFQIIYSFNFSNRNKIFYRKWYKDYAAWSNSFQYSIEAFELVNNEFIPYEEQLMTDLGISQCIIAKLK